MNIIEFLFALIKAVVPISDVRRTQLEKGGTDWFNELQNKEVNNRYLVLLKEHANAWYTQTFLAVFYIFALRWTMDYISSPGHDEEDED